MTMVDFRWEGCSPISCCVDQRRYESPHGSTCRPLFTE